MEISEKCMKKVGQQDFQGRVKYLMQKAAIAIIGEDGSKAEF